MSFRSMTWSARTGCMDGMDGMGSEGRVADTG